MVIMSRATAARRTLDLSGNTTRQQLAMALVERIRPHVLKHPETFSGQQRAFIADMQEKIGRCGIQLFVSQKQVDLLIDILERTLGEIV